MTEAQPASFSWTMLLIALFAVLASVGAVLLWRNRRKSPGEPLIVPLIERPKVAPKPGQEQPPQADPQPVQAPSPEPAPTDAEPTPAAPEAPPKPAPAPTPTPAAIAEQDDNLLKISIEARQLAISLTAATLSYRITLSNLGKTSLRDILISGDMISAHSSMSQDEQVATAHLVLKEAHQVDRLPAQETMQINGEFRLPFTSIRPIRTSNASLVVPLARLRAEARNGGEGVVVLTALVGQKNEQPQSALQPFRLDLGPRIYKEVTQRIFS